MKPFSSATFPAIPFDTAKAAWALYERDNFNLAIGDQANRLFYGLLLVDLEGQLRKPTHTLAMLYLVTIFQYLETLSDKQAVEAVEERVEWKYALHLPLRFPGLAPVWLCEFRRWLIIEPAAQRSLQMLIERLSDVINCPSKLNSGLEASQVISAICQTSRLARIWETLNEAMEALATKRPEWLACANLPHRFERYRYPQITTNLGTDRLERHAMIHIIGADGFYLLNVISESGAPGLVNLPEVLNLFHVWGDQFEPIDGQVVWRKEACVRCSLFSMVPQLSNQSNQKIYSAGYKETTSNLRINSSTASW